MDPASGKMIAPLPGVIARYWVPILLLYLVTRLFSGFEYFQLVDDQCKYLTIARTFPYLSRGSPRYSIPAYSFVRHPPFSCFS